MAVTITAAQATVMVKALIDAEHYRMDTASAWCVGCAATQDGACPDHVAFVAPAGEYRELAAALATALTQSAGRDVCPPRPASDLSRLGQERTMTTNLTMTEPTAAERADETFTCCETPLPWPARTEDRTCPECGTVWEHDGIDLGAGARIKPELAPREAGLAAPSLPAICEAADLGPVRQAPAGRPYWLAEPCPAWCGYPEAHQSHDHPDDRVHMGSTWDVTLTLEVPEVNFPRDPAGKIEVSVPHLDIWLQQRWREIEPRVELSVSDMSGISLTLAEAASLAEALAGLVRQAGGRPS